MKAFEKYFISKNKYLPIHIGDYYRDSKDTWRAALEEALKHETDLESTELGDWIRKELEEE
jgi:hypothetical protein